MSVVIAADAVPLQVDEYGSIRVGGTRVRLESVLDVFKQERNAEAIAESSPTLRLADIYSVIGYYLLHQSELDQYLEERAARAEQVRRDIDARGDQIGLRERLLARRDERSS